MTNEFLLDDDGYGDLQVDTDDIITHVTAQTHDAFVAWIGTRRGAASNSQVSIRTTEINLDAEGGVAKEIIDQFRWVLGKSFRVPIKAWSVCITGDQYEKTRVCTEIGRVYAAWYTKPDDTVWLFQRIGDWKFRYDDRCSLHGPVVSCYDDPNRVGIPSRGGYCSVPSDLASDKYFCVNTTGHDPYTAASLAYGRICQLLRDLHSDRITAEIDKWTNRGKVA